MAHSKIVVFALLVAVACALPQEDSFTKDNRKAINEGFGGPGGLGPNGYGGFNGYNGPNRYPGQFGYNQNPYSPYGQNPYGPNQYGQNQYGQNPYGQNPYGQNPYGNRLGQGAF